MNLMREQHFRRNCAQHTISVASALFGECRTEENAEFAELCDRIVSRPGWSVAVSAATLTFGGARARRDDHAMQSIRLRSDLRRWPRVARSAAQGACGRAL